MKFAVISALALVIGIEAQANSAIKAGNKLGLKLAREAATDKFAGKNFMVSPVSLQQALTLAMSGTASQTRVQSEELIGSLLDTVNLDNKKALKGLSFSVSEKKEYQEKYPYSNPTVVSIQNGLWHTNGKTDGRRFAFSSEFKKIAAESYGAEVAALDFKQQSAADAINGWAKEKTHGLIPKIIDLDALKPMLWVVLNATYIEASWRKAFTLVKQDAPLFTLSDGKQVKAAMIQSEQYISYAPMIDGGELAAIPMSSIHGGPELEFVIHIPGQLEGQGLLDENFWARAQGLLADRRAVQKAHVVLPKFSFNTSVEMKKDDGLTKAMGVEFLYQNWADFSAMATADSRESKVGLIKQDSRIELDEKGIKAAAVTLVGGIERTSIPSRPTVNLVVDRPFQFAIVEKSTKAILFVGSVVDPC